MTRGRRSIALATYAGAPDLAPDDRLLLQALAAAGFDAAPVVWSDPDARWDAFGAVLIRSCWDYHLRIDEFHAWLDRLGASGLAVFNSPDLIRWNSNKHYLIDLSARGVAVIPTRIVPAGDVSAVERIAAAEGWTSAVIKPAVSASGYETYSIRFPLDPNDRARVARATAAGDALLQPFAEEIPRNGEYSLTFIDGAFSHATLKRAAGGEFRVQVEHGGSVASVEVRQGLIEQAARVLEHLPEVPLYARVDGIDRDGAFLLMELELIEPNLFLAHGAGAADRLAAALTRRASIRVP